MVKFPSVDDMVSARATAVVHTWAALQRWTTKASEMNHATERRQLSAAVAPGRAFLHHARGFFLDKHRLEHINAGGQDPQERAKLKKGAQQHANNNDIQIAEDPVQNMLPTVLDLSPATGVLLEDLQAIAGMPIRDAPRFRALADDLAAAGPSQLASGCAATGAEAAPPAPAPVWSGRGGNPYLLYLNQLRRGLKMQIGDRPMTKQEQADLARRAQGSYQALSREERDALRALYASRVQRRKRGELKNAAAPPDKRYNSHFGMGEPMSVISPKKFCQAASPACAMVCSGFASTTLFVPSVAIHTLACGPGVRHREIVIDHGHHGASGGKRSPRREPATVGAQHWRELAIASLCLAPWAPEAAESGGAWCARPALVVCTSSAKDCLRTMNEYSSGARARWVAEPQAQCRQQHFQ